MLSLIEKIQAGQQLLNGDIKLAVSYLIDETSSPELKEKFLKALTQKGETPEEIAFFVEALLEHAVDPELEKLALTTPTIDVCGTGGDQLDLFNISTTSMFVIAASGATVVKHGNRGITSKSGGADVLEALGIKLDSDTETFRKCIETANVGFLFAPLYHPTFKAIAPIRKKLADQGIRTIFNLIGPLLNPAKPDYQLVGICQSQLRNDYAQILTQLGRKSAWVVHGHTLDGRSVDEVSLMGSTDITIAGTDTPHTESSISPEELGFPTAKISEIKGGEAAENAQILIDILSGKEQGAKRNIIILNAAAGIACAQLAPDLSSAIPIATEAIDSGRALQALQKLQNIFL